MTHRRLSSSPLAALAGLVLSLTPTLLAPAPAAGAPAPRVAMTVAGPGGDELRAAVVSRMKRHCQIVPASAGADPASVRRLRLSAFVDGRVSSGTSWRVKL